MSPRNDLKMFTLRHFLFYMGVTCLAGAAIGGASRVTGWSTGVIYAVGLTAGTVISILAIRESLFAPPRHRGERQPHRHA